MVGSPKDLRDLHRIEARVRITCSCKAAEICELDALINEVRNNGGTDWQTARYALMCPKRCASPMIKLTPIPFGRQRARRQAHRHVLTNLWLGILREADGQSAQQPVGTIEVRVDLHVLLPFVRDHALLNAFWRTAAVEPRHAWTSCHLTHSHIARRLIDAGAPAEDANRP